MLQQRSWVSATSARASSRAENTSRHSRDHMAGRVAGTGQRRDRGLSL